MEVVWKHIGQAERYASAMLKGGNKKAGSVLPVDNALVRQKIREMKETLAGLKDITKKRLELKEVASVF